MVGLHLFNVLVYCHANYNWLWRFARREPKRDALWYLLHAFQLGVDFLHHRKHDKCRSSLDQPHQKFCMFSLSVSLDLWCLNRHLRALFDELGFACCRGIQFELLRSLQKEISYPCVYRTKCYPTSASSSKQMDWSGKKPWMLCPKPFVQALLTTCFSR